MTTPHTSSVQQAELVRSNALADRILAVLARKRILPLFRPGSSHAQRDPATLPPTALLALVRTKIDYIQQGLIANGIATKAELRILDD